MANVVKNVLESIAERESNYKTTDVIKDIDVEIDEGNLLAVDKNEIDLKALKSSKEDYLISLARDDCQLLINKIWELPISRVQEAVVATLPEPTTRLPREKPVPKPKPETKWEKYAKLKGIQKTKRGRKVWDEELKEWRPRWGYKRANDPEREWVLEVPDNADPMEDQFSKIRKQKKERIAKNELQRLRNIARNMKGKVTGVGLVPTEEPDKHQMNRAIVEARRSTASLGKFTDKLPKEKPAKNTGKKRKFEPNHGDSGKEKKRMLDIFNNVYSDKPTLDIAKAVNKHMAQEEESRSAINRENRGKKKAGNKGKHSGKKGAKGGRNKGGKFTGSKAKGGKSKGRKGKK